MSTQSDLVIQQKDEIDLWRSKARNIVNEFDKVKHILLKRRGAFNIEEWNEIQKLIIVK